MQFLTGLHRLNNLGRNCSLVEKCGCGGMVDAADSKSASGDRVGVQVPSAVPPNAIVAGNSSHLAVITPKLLTSRAGDLI